MPTYVFGSSSSSHDNGNKIDTSKIVQKPYLRTIYVESNSEEDINMENQFKIKKLSCPPEISDDACKSYVDSGPSIKLNTAHVDLEDKNLDNVRFFKRNSLPAVRERFTPKFYVVEAFSHSVDEPTLARSNQDNDFSNHNSTNINSITLNSQAVNHNQVPTKAYTDQFHQEKEQSQRDLGLHVFNESIESVKNNQVNFPNNYEHTNLDCITVNREPTTINELANKKDVDDSLGGGINLRFNQTLQNYL